MGSSIPGQEVRTVKRTDRRTDTDGGTETVFGTIPEQEEPSETERLRRLYETWVVMPFRIIWSDWRARVGMLIILTYIVMALSTVFVPSPATNQADRLLLPFQDWRFPLGADGMGQGLLRQVIHATPAMFKMIFSGAVFATILATVIGLVSGYKGGKVDRVLMTISDIVVTIPGLMLVIILAAWFKPRSPYVVGILLASHRWAGFARSLRAQTLTIREESYVEASRALDLTTTSIVSKDLLPNLAPLISIYFMNACRGIIFSSVGLYFLGVLPFTTLNWGVQLNLAYETGGALYSWEIAHWLIVPMVAIVGLSLGLILFAQGMDRLFNPRIRAKHDTSLESEDTEDNEPSTTSAINK